MLNDILHTLKTLEKFALLYGAIKVSMREHWGILQEKEQGLQLTTLFTDNKIYLVINI